MRRVKPNLAAVLLLTSIPARAQEAPAVLELIPGPEPAALLRSTSPGTPLFTPACRGLVWEVLDAERGLFAPLTREPCAASANAKPLDETGIATRPPEPPFYPASLRAVALVGTNCTPDRPFSVAECGEVFTVTSSPVTLQKPEP